MLELIHSKREESRLQQLLRSVEVEESEYKNPNMESFCDLFMTFLVLEGSLKKEFECTTYMKKARSVLQMVGQDDLVCDLLKRLLDSALIQRKIKGFVFRKLVDDNQPIKELETALLSEFSEEERKVLESFAPPLSIHSVPPIEFSEILGTGPYMLSGSKDSNELLGLEDDITVTDEERSQIEDGGISFGALIFLYLVCALA
jgi:hypothetical protein